MIDARFRKNIDLPLLLITFLIAALGILTLYSVSQESATRYYQKQMVFLVAGFVLMLVMSTIDYNRFPRFVRPLYAINIGMLLVVMGFAAKKGAQRWIPLGGFQLQPSEFAKLIITMHNLASPTPSAARVLH